MKIILKIIVVALTFLISLNSVYASDSEQASQAASKILTTLQQNDYDKLWDDYISKWYKEKLTKDSFMANMSIGRQTLGAPNLPPKLIDMAYSQYDPSTGYKGEIYVFNFFTSYNVGGNFYERLVLIKESDGNFRLSGIWGAPATSKK